MFTDGENTVRLNKLEADSLELCGRESVQTSSLRKKEVNFRTSSKVKNMDNFYSK